MAEHTSRDEVRQLADLMRLRFDDAELDQMVRSLDDVLGRVAVLADLDLDDVEPTIHLNDLHNVWRPDEVGPTLSNEEALAAAPATEAGQFSVPTILGETP